MKYGYILNADTGVSSIGLASEARSTGVSSIGRASAPTLECTRMNGKTERPTAAPKFSGVKFTRIYADRDFLALARHF